MSLSAGNVFVCGNLLQFGEWDYKSAFSLTRSTVGTTWVGTTLLPANTQYEWKVVVTRGTTVIWEREWEHGNRQGSSGHGKSNVNVVWNIL